MVYDGDEQCEMYIGAGATMCLGTNMVHGVSFTALWCLHLILYISYASSFSTQSMLVLFTIVSAFSFLKQLLSHSDFSYGKFGLLSLGKESQLRQSCATEPVVHAGCFSVSIIHQTLNIDNRIFKVRTDVDACDCAWECTDTKRV